jgi:site-specific recombinase XerD
MGARIKPRSLDTSDRYIAERRKRQYEHDLDSGVNPSVKWKEFVDGYFAQLNPNTAKGTREKYKRVLERFVRFAECRGLGHVGAVMPSVVDAYLKDRATDIHPTRKTPVGRSTLRVDLLILHGMFSHAVRSRIMEENPVSLRGFEKGRSAVTLPFEQFEIEGMLRVASTIHHKALLLFFLHTGLRISDVSDMTKRAVNLAAGNIIWKTKKRGKMVYLPIHPRLSEALSEHLKAHNPVQRLCSFLFPTRTGKKDFEQTIDAKLRRIFKLAEIENGHAHRFRDTFAVRLLEKGATLYDVSKLLAITIKVAEEHYSPYVQELQARGKRLVNTLDFVA